MSTIHGSYNKLKNSIIAITVEIEDKEKVCKMLEKKLHLERSVLSQVEAKINEEYEIKLSFEADIHRQRCEAIVKESNQCVEEKRKILSSCQELMESAQKAEADIAHDIRKLMTEIDLRIEKERKLFRATQDDRMQKFLSEKANEHKESTAKALQPEFNRLQQQHELDVAEIEFRTKQQERQLREEFQHKLTQRLEQDKQAARERHRNLIKDLSFTTSAEVSDVEREQRQQLACLQDDLEKDLERLKAALGKKIEKERRAGQREIDQTQESCQKRLEDLRALHARERAVLKKDHDAQMREIASAAERERVEEEGTGGGGGEGKEGGSSGRGAGAGAGAGEEDEALVEAQRERDKRIQHQIRQLQAETVRLERAWAKKAEEDRAAITQASSLEERESQRRHRQLTNEVADLVVRRDQLAADINDLTLRVGELEEEVKEVERERRVYEEGVAAHKQRARDLEEEARRVRQEGRRAAEGREAEQRVRMERLAALVRRQEEDLQSELDVLDRAHTAELDALDKQVKAELAEKEQIIRALEDAIQAQGVKADKLEALIRQYSSSAADVPVGKGVHDPIVGSGGGSGPSVGSGGTRSASGRSVGGSVRSKTSGGSIYDGGSRNAGGSGRSVVSSNTTTNTTTDRRKR